MTSSSNWPTVPDDFPSAGAMSGRKLSDIDGTGQSHSALLGWHGSAIENLETEVDVLLDSLDSSQGSGRLFVAGHSYASHLPDVFGGWYGDTKPARESRLRWPNILGDIFGIAPVFIQRQIAAQTAGAADVSTLICLAPDEALVEAAVYVPNAAVTGANTNYFQHELRVADPSGWVVFGNRQFTSGQNMTDPATGTSGQTLEHMPNVGYAGTNTLLPRDATNALTTALGKLKPGWALSLLQVQNGSGMLDPGGLLVVRLGTALRNCAVASAFLEKSGVYHGGWATMVRSAYDSAPPGNEVVTSAAHSGGATTINCDATGGIVFGQSVYFANGVTATNVVISAGATSGSCTALAGAIPKGTVGFAGSTSGERFLNQTPSHVALLCWGINSAGESTFDDSAWRESLRFAIAFNLCSYYSFDVTTSNVFQYTAGNGAGAAWANVTNVAAGQLPFAAKKFTGAIGATKPTITLSVGPNFEGGTIDLFFYALGGTSRGGSADITVDGVAAATVDTIDVSPLLNVETLTAVTASTTTITGASVYDFRMDGMVIEKTDIPVGTRLTSVATSSSATISAAATGSASGTATLRGYTPMVKRLTGLAAGSHSIVVELQSMSETTGLAQFLFAGWGWEATDPTAPVIVCNTAKINATSNYDVGNTDDHVNTQNTETEAVLAGIGAVVGTNTVEPALPDTVVIADIDAALNQDPLNYVEDGIHPSPRGHLVIADTVLRSLRRLETEALMSR